MTNGDVPIPVPASCSPKVMRPAIAVVSLVGSFFIFAMIGKGYADLQWEKTIMLIVGALIANVTTVINWYFGSSEDSSKKTDILAAK